jgi:hypothetical protein
MHERRNSPTFKIWVESDYSEDTELPPEDDIKIRIERGFRYIHEIRHLNVW